MIATGRIDTTRAALVRATLVDGQGGARDRAGRGGGAAAGHARGPARAAGGDRRGGARAAGNVVIADVDDVAARRRARAAAKSVARAGVEAAILDAWARLTGLPLLRGAGRRGRDRAGHRHHAADLRARADGRRARARTAAPASPASR